LSQEEGKLLATHPRLKGHGKFQTNPAHYPSWKIVSKTEYQERYRQKTAAIGPEAERYFHQIVRLHFQPQLNKRSIFDCATCEFIRKKENILFIGPPGVGNYRKATGIKVRKGGPGRPHLLPNSGDHKRPIRPRP